MLLTAPPSWPTVLAGWAAPTVTQLLVLLALAGYLWALRRLPRAASGPVSWPARRTGCWLLAGVVLVVAVDGPVGRYGEVLFWVHMTQHLLLIMVVPLLLVWAQPLALALAVSGPAGRARLEAALAHRVVRWVSAPLTGLVVYSAVVVLTHLTGFQQVSVTHPAARAAELLGYLVAGYLFFLSVGGAEHGPWSLPYLFRFLVLALGMGADTLTGVALMLTSQPLAPAYAAAHPGWGPSVLADQELAGAIMWFGGDLLMMLMMIVVAVQWGRAGADRQGLGGWLEGARREAVLGGAHAGGRGPDTGDGAEVDIDTDQRALDQYNAMLAARREQPPDRR